MKIQIAAAAACIVAVCSCSPKKQASAIPAPGTVIAHIEEPVVEDTLNKFVFKATLKADSLVEKGVYDLTAEWGYNKAESKFTMPKGGEQFVPMLRRGKDPYTFVVGFKTDKDTTFYDYLSIVGIKGYLKVRYLKSYSFE